MNKQALEHQKSRIMAIKSETERLIATMPANHPARNLGAMSVSAMEKDLKMIDDELASQALPQPEKSPSLDTAFAEFMKQIAPKDEAPCGCPKCTTARLEIWIPPCLPVPHHIAFLEQAREQITQKISELKKGA
jgi:hypothetical protein